MVDTAFRVVLYLDICIGLGALFVLQSPGPAMDGNGTMPVARRACLDREGVRGAGGVSTPSGSRSMGSGVSPVSSGVSPVFSGVSPMSNDERVSEPPEIRNNSGSAHGSIWRAVKIWFC